MYHVKWSFEPHDIDGIGCDSYEYEAHCVEVEGSPAMFEEHIWVSGEEDDKIDFLGFVGDADDVFVG